MHQLNGPYEIEMEFDEDYSERNIDGARMVTKFKWQSNLDGSYRLSIDNKLTLEKSRTDFPLLPNGANPMVFPSPPKPRFKQ